MADFSNKICKFGFKANISKNTCILFKEVRKAEKILNASNFFSRNLPLFYNHVNIRISEKSSDVNLKSWVYKAKNVINTLG